MTPAVAVSGSNLVLTIPAGTYENCVRYCIRIVQDIPSTATNLMPVVIKIGAGATLYNINRRCGHRLYANQVRTRRNYALRVAADSATFVLECGYVASCNCGIVTGLPVVTAEEPAEVLAGSKKAVSKDA